METVVETPPFLSDAAAAGMSETERTAFADWISAHPDAGDLLAARAKYVTRALVEARVAAIGSSLSSLKPPLRSFSSRCSARANVAISLKQCNALATMTKRLLGAYRRPRITTNGAQP